MYATSLSHLLHVDSKAADTWAEWARKHTAFIETANKEAVHQEQLKIARSFGTIGFICASGAYGGAGVTYNPNKGLTDTVDEQEAITVPDDGDSYVIDHPLEVRGYRPPIVITALPIHSVLSADGKRGKPTYNIKVSFYLTQVPKSQQDVYPSSIQNGPMRIINKSDCPNWLITKLEKLVERKGSQYIPTLKLLGVQEPVFAINSSRDITNFGLFLGKTHAYYAPKVEGIPRPALPALFSMLSRDLRPLAELMQLKGNYTFPQ